MAVALLAAALASLCLAQPQAPTTENQARYYVYGAFLTHAVPEIMGERVALGPELAQRLGVQSGADRQRIYDALMSYTDGKRLAVRKATPGELSAYQGRRDLKSPVFTVQAGDIRLLVEYDMQANTIPFVGQLDVVPQAPVVEQRAAPPPPVAAPKPAAAPPAPAVATPKPPAPTVAVAAPKPAAAKPAPVRAVPPPAAPAEVLRPNGPCLVKPVMSEQDLANCRAAPGGVTSVNPGPPAVVKPQARVAPPAPIPQRTGPCEIKPVMSEEDLANCRAAPGGAPRVDAGSPPAARPQVRAQPQQPERRSATPCEIKPVMSEEDLIACGIRR